MKRNRHCVPWCCGLLLAAAIGNGIAAQTADMDALLERADDIRSSDPAQFQHLLGRLEAMKADATPTQLELLAYLSAYSRGIRGDYEEAIRQAKALLSSTSDVNMQARTGAYLVNMYALTRRFTEGLRQLEITLSLLDRVDNPAYREHVLGVAAVVHNQAGQYRLGRQYAERVLESTDSPRASCYAGQSRLEARQNLASGDSDGARFEDDLNELIRLCAGQGEAVVANLGRAMLARHWAAGGQREKAIALLKAYLDEARASQYVPLVSEFEAQLAEYQLEEGNLQSATEHAAAAIALNSGVEFTRHLVSAYRSQYRIAEAVGDSAAALASYRAYAEADKAYLNEVKAREMAYQIVRHEALQQTQQIELLNQRNTVLELQQRVAEQRAQNTGLLAVLLTMLLATIGFWAYKTKRVQIRLRRLAEADMLTGISNRHHFTQRAGRALEQCARGGEDAVLVMFDLDHFKLVNDRFGHAAGDCALRLVAAACLPLCRPVDAFGRLGGEEFGILLPGCDLAAGRRLAEDCIARFGEIQTADCGHLFKITASFGVTNATVSGYDLTRMLSHADRALYRAKRSGRNRICVYDVGLDAAALSLASSSVAGPVADQQDHATAHDRRLDIAVG